MAVNLDIRLQFIKAFLCFTQFTPDQYAELAQLMQEKFYQPGEIIVVQNDLIDAVYIIIEGEAEVTLETTRRKKIIQTPVAMLHSGEAIGLNDTDFYSKTGKRTATVTAVTTMTLLHLDIKDLYGFLQKHNLELTMYAASKQMLRMKLIKQSLPFAKVTHERLQWLADHVEEIKLPAGEILFSEGDKGDKCYLIQHGKIELTVQHEDVSHQLAVLGPPALFGEATMITHAPRNATARAAEDAELFVLRHEYLTELIETEASISNMFMTLMVDRSRPLQHSHVTVHHRTAADGQELTILKNPDTGAYFKLSDEGYYIWQQLDGNHTLQEITLGLADQFNLFAPNVVAGLISKLTSSGFVSNVNITNDLANKNVPTWRKLINKIIDLLNIRIPLGDADGWLTSSYNKYVHYLFTPIGQRLMVLFGVMGFIIIAVSTNHVLNFFSHHKLGLLLVFMLYPLSIFDHVMHELAHAYAVKAAGREVHHMGIGWMYSGPIAFTDTSDMWLAGRRERIRVNMAGIYADLLFSALCGFLILIIPNPYILGLLWLMAIYTYVDAFREMNPLQELDGYYLLMDITETNRLREHSVAWLVRKFPKCLKNPSLFKENKPEMIYWLSSTTYLVSVCIITLLLQFFVLKVFGLAEHNPYLALLTPLGVVLWTAYGIIAEIRNKADE